MHVAVNEPLRNIRLFFSSDAQAAVTDMLRERYLFSSEGAAIINKNAYWDKASEAAGRGTWELALLAEERIADRLIEDVREIADRHPFINEHPYGIPG